MKYYSTNRQSPASTFKDATVLGQAPDKGLYFPEHIPSLPASFFREIEGLTKEEIAFRVMQPYVGDEIPEAELWRIVAETIDFPFPLVGVTENISSLELFHGPTLAFKDVGARFMSRCLGYFSKDRADKVYVLVATSGDTGGAVANGFYEVEGVEVVILYPSGKVSSVQEKQLTTLGKNIHALEVDGSFDDCQRLVKQAFTDQELTSEFFLTSANSINVARWLPQQLYYFFAWAQWREKNNPPVFCVPSGNFGNICAGLVAARSGLPAKHFIAACNANSVVPDYFKSGEYRPQPARATMSNAMDVGDPSNFVRMLELFDRQYGRMKEFISSYSITDEQTAQTIREVFSQHHYLPDPHGAVAFAALKTWLEEHDADAGIFLETAHPIKFYDAVEPLTGEKVPVPAGVEDVLRKEKHSIRISAAYDEFKSVLIADLLNTPS